MRKEFLYSIGLILVELGFGGLLVEIRFSRQLDVAGVLPKFFGKV